jgi:tripartite-type tricarboxylate transporter receptor subunit TctC
MRRRKFLASGGALAAASIGTPAIAQQFPSRPVRVIVPYPAGGIVDSVARAVTDKLSQDWGQPVIVDARPGANSNIGTEAVARAPADGYTWLITGPAFMANPTLYGNLSWSEKSFVGIGAAAWVPSMLVVHPSLANDLAGFVALAKQKPGAMNYGNPGIGSSIHLNTALFLAEAGIEVQSVAYKGQPQGILDLMENRIQMQFTSVGLIAQHVRSGKLKALAVVGRNRARDLPDVPTLAEAGYPGANVVPWYGFLAPSGTPGELVTRINRSILTALADPAVQTRLRDLGCDVVAPMDPGQLADLVRTDTERYVKVIRSANIKAE